MMATPLHRSPYLRRNLSDLSDLSDLATDRKSNKINMLSDLSDLSDLLSRAHTRARARVWRFLHVPVRIYSRDYQKGWTGWTGWTKV